MPQGRGPLNFTAARARSFESMAAAYDLGRPGYPDALYEDLAALVPPPASVLEIGAGTGHATAALAARGYRIVALEPGPQLARLARRKVAGRGLVEVLETPFEAWTPGPRRFEMIAAATSFHWLDTDVARQRCAQALDHGGVVAVWLNLLDPERNLSLLQRSAHIYARVAPSIDTGERVATPERIALSRPALDGGPFQALPLRTYAWTIRYDWPAYRRLLESFSDHRLLTPSDRGQLYRELEGMIAAAGHDGFDYHLVTVLHLFRRLSE